MLIRLLLIILCFSMSMLCSCKPGDVCGPGKIIDCSSNCIDESDVNNLLGDGTCDENLNCSEFNYDDGDCGGTSPTTTTTSITSPSTTTTTASSGCDPDPVAKESIRIHKSYNDYGVCYAIALSIKVENRGCAGEIYLKLTSDQWPSYSDCVVAFMDAGEERFIGPILFDDMRFCDQYFDLTFTVETRNAQPSDFPECKKPPEPEIISPEDGSSNTLGESITFAGEAEISYDGELTGNSLVWISSIDGQIGIPAIFN